MSKRIQETFQRARERGRPCFVSYICAGDPDPETCLEVCRTLVDNGVDIMELGVPFSDPLADGLTNQLAAERALAAGMTQEKVFELVRSIRNFSDAPIVLYTYYNLVFSQGVEDYVRRAKEAGVDALLTLDLPPEESAELADACSKHDMGMVFIMAPTTPESRMQIIADATTAFIYYVSREGVTGERSDMAANIGSQVAAIRKYAKTPLVVGFGISQPEHVRAIAAIADGVVVGSSLVNCIAHNLGDRTKILDTLKAKVQTLFTGFQPS